MKLVRFEDVYGKETYVNPDHVSFIRDYGNGSTAVYFGSNGEPGLNVNMSPGEIASQFGWQTASQKS